LVPTIGEGFGQLGHQTVFMSFCAQPSHLPLEPLPVRRPLRYTGGVTHWKLVPLPQGAACRPFWP
jgi:hypothetical protein